MITASFSFLVRLLLLQILIKYFQSIPSLDTYSNKVFNAAQHTAARNGAIFLTAGPILER